MNTTAAPCPYGCDYCEFRQINESMYSVGCADSCDASRCVNATQLDCVKDCCNTTHCLNATLLAMEPTTSPTVPMTTKKATMTTTTTTTAPTTRASNGMKCKSLTCTGADCYTTSTPVMTWCYGDTETYCKLMKMTEGSTATWMAGCSVDCTEQTACGASTPACHQECCMASAAGDCLKLDGKLNMPNSGGGGSTQALPSTLMGLLGPCLMLWMMVFMGELL
ncbi:integumentary mucin C.1 [Engraulis encrasicolus]|uniref:integumentary mucin C.1 n=1 Tax=Engraulis encrasicolus TaxID=184585 RepID=UPI002FD5121F